MATPTEKETFSTLIKNRIAKEQISVLESIMDHCETTGLEVEVAATLLTDELKMIMAVEASNLNLLKRDKLVKKVKRK